MPSKGKRIRKIAFSIFLLFLALSLLIVYLRYLNFKKTIIEKALQKASFVIGQRVHIENLSINLLGTINLYDITIKNPEGFTSGQLLRIKRLHLDVRLSELLKGRFSLRNIILYSPDLTLMRDEKGRYNISDGLMGFFSEKSTTKYQVDEFRIDSGIFDMNKDERYRGDSINVRLKNLSSDPNTRTEIKGTVVYAGNRIQMDGWITLNDPPKKFTLSISSKDFALSPFRKTLDTYRIDIEKTRMNVDLHIDGDAEKGFHITSNLQVKRVGVPLLNKEISDIRLRADTIFNLHDRSLIVNAASFYANGLSTVTLKGVVPDLQNPSYQADIKIDRLDLSKLNLMKGLKVKGILSSNNLRIKGKFESKVPGLSGSFQFKEGGIESPHGIIEKIDADFIFSLNKEISIKGEGLARVVKGGQYSLTKPLDVRLSATLHGTQERMDIISSLSLSSLEIKFKDEKTLSLNSGNVTMEGTMKGSDFSVKNSLEIKGVRFADRSIPWLKSRSTIDYQKGEMTIRNPLIETEDLKLSANDIRITTPESKMSYTVEIKGMNAAYRATEALIKEGDFHLTLSPGKETVTGDLRFSAKNILSQGITFSHVSGIGRFDDKNFSLDIDGVEFAGGRIKGAVQGRISEDLFPLRTTFLAEGIDLSAILNIASKSIKLPYHVTGEMKRASFEGTLNSQESLNGNASVEARKVSVFNPTTKQNLAKDAFINADIEFKGKDLSFKGEATAGHLSTRLSGIVKGLMANEMNLQAKGVLAEVKISDIRNTFWDIFPDSLLYVGLQGSVSSNVSFDYGKDGLDIKGNLLLKDFILEGENGEYAVGPINGTLPIKYGKDQSEKEEMTLPSFEKSQFDRLSHTYAQETVKEDLYKLTVGSLRYGFPLLENITLLIKQKGNLWNIERFSANIFGGKLNGSAIMDLSNGFHYRVGLLVKGLSLGALCDGIEPIKGFISGKVDGIASFRASEIGLSQLMGMADFWTYSTETEKTIISKEFLQKVGGPSLKASLRNRNFNKGILGLYLKDGHLIFKDLEISNRNFLGITDLSVKVAPLSNRIALDHLLTTIAEAAERAKNKK
jgi:hypothetical protein